MDKTEYIESGILEAYVLGMLSHQESLEVEDTRLENPEIHAELLVIEDAMEVYAGRFAKIPPVGMQAAIMTAIQRIDSTPKSDTLSQKPGPSANAFNWKLPFGILLAGLLGALAFAFNNYNAKVQLSDQVEQQNAIMVTNKAECDKAKNEKNALEKQLIFLRGIDNQTIRMSGTDKAPEAFATIFWNDITKESYLGVGSLPVPPADKQYQLWAIVDGAPVDMKVFDVTTDNNQLHKVEFIEKPQAFAVTLEDVGGSSAPTMEEMYVIGEVAAG